MGNMENTSGNRRKIDINIGLLAHVDAGKTTLSESILYEAGTIRKMGRVDKGNAFLDTHELERSRGITIFSKQAVLELGNMCITLMDTPGHVDFSAEMERTLQVLDYAILVISGADGVQGHAHTLWSLLRRYDIPVFLFINKMDQDGTDRDRILEQLIQELDDGCVDFSGEDTEIFAENIAMCDEAVMEDFLEHGAVKERDIRRLICERKIFPCYFGSALRMEGVSELLKGIEKFAEPGTYPEIFGARVFKIARDEQGNRLTHMKITGGSLKVRDVLSKGEVWEEKVNQIRIYSGEKYEAVQEAYAGQICAVTGLTKTFPGEGLGEESKGSEPMLEPVLTYRVLLPEGCDPARMLPNFRMLEEEEPELHVLWDEELKEIQVQVMGEVQLEVLKSIVTERFDTEIEFDTGNIVYKETILNRVEGVGHFEPLRHYAEVHLILESGERGSGMQFVADCSEDVLDRNWQRLILTHLMEREHQGVLTGSALTDMKITLAAGRAHQKHTEGGDFRQATYRAVRQGLMQAESQLLEPWYEFRLEVPENCIGRAMTDIEKLHGKVDAPEQLGETAVLTGCAPVSTMRNYAAEVTAYTRGMGHLFCTLKGYEPCWNEAEVVAASGYDPERDLRNPSGSVFCAHGAGFAVNWDDVPAYMHLESVLQESAAEEPEPVFAAQEACVEDEWIDPEEVDRILDQTFNANKHAKSAMKRGIKKRKTTIQPVYRSFDKPKTAVEEYLLVDGYNVIFAWEDLSELAETNLDGARGKLLDVLCNYQAVKKCNLIAVFDAYRIKGHQTEIMDYHNIHVVFTKEAETADQYIEKFAHENGRKYHVTVATSDGVEQVIIRGQGCTLLSARELREEIRMADTQSSSAFEERRSLERRKEKNYLLDAMSPEERKRLDEESLDKTI